ncbi:hypothetical protein ACPESR_06430 [Nocardia testacea]|uniref:hypothetical protein n=1 Tax=Nocardia testacea TaxID=248551 RepID=UPI003C2D2065
MVVESVSGVVAHLSEGNIGEARHAYTVFRRLILRELGVPPSPQLTGLLTRPPVPTGADRPPGRREAAPVSGRFAAGPVETRADAAPRRSR